MSDIIKNNNLFNRVNNIINIAHKNIVSSVNINMVVAYWMIGREIILEVQGGEKRAEYGKQVIKGLSAKLTKEHKKGFSEANLTIFKKFYLTFPERITISYPVGTEFKSYSTNEIIQHPMGTEFDTSKLDIDFSPQLTWSHYRALMRVKDETARAFYEKEAIECGWDKRGLERQIHSAYYQRIIRNHEPEKMLENVRKEKTESISAVNILKTPTVLEFLGLPDEKIRESDLETAIIGHIQNFLLELGKGFAFVARQKKMQYEESSLYIDLVFYNSILKCYLLIDLKMGELSHKDVGQMDSYVRMFDDLFTVDDDKPTIGLILCSEKNSTVAKYSVLNDRKQIFASKYMLYMPTEEELQEEINREIKLLENNKLLKGEKEYV